MIKILGNWRNLFFFNLSLLIIGIFSRSWILILAVVIISSVLIIYSILRRKNLSIEDKDKKSTKGFDLESGSSKDDSYNKDNFIYEITAGRLGGEHTIGTIPKSLSDYWSEWEQDDLEGYLFSFDREEDYPNVPEKYHLNEWNEIDDITHQNSVEFSATNYFEITNTETNDSFYIDFQEINSNELFIDESKMEKVSTSNELILFCQSWEKGEFIVECNDNDGNPCEFITNEPFDLNKIKNVKCTRFSEILLLNSFEYENYTFEVSGGDTMGKGMSAWLVSNNHVDNKAQKKEIATAIKGTALLAKVKELGDISKSDLVRSCGYVIQKENGEESLDFTGFYEAILEAKAVGINTNFSDSEERTEDSQQPNLSKSIEEALIRIISDNIKEYGISDLQEIYDDSIQRSFDFSRLEGSYESTLYEWIHIYLKNTGLYNSFLNATQLAQAKAVPEGKIYGPNNEEDENYEGIQEQIDELHWDCILVVAKEGIRQGLNIYGIPEYLENCGMDEYLEEINSIKVDKSNNGVADYVNSENSWETLDEEEIIERLKGTEVPIDIIRKFVNSENWEIRRTIALREDLPLEIIEKLRNDDDIDVKDAVAYRELPIEWRKLDDDKKIEKLKDEGNVDSDIIKILSASSNSYIRTAIARCSSTSSEIIERLAQDDDDDVKDAVLFRDLPEQWNSLDSDQIISKIDNKIDLETRNILEKSSNREIKIAIREAFATERRLIVNGMDVGTENGVYINYENNCYADIEVWDSAQEYQDYLSGEYDGDVEEIPFTPGYKAWEGDATKYNPEQITDFLEIQAKKILQDRSEYNENIDTSMPLYFVVQWRDATLFIDENGDLENYDARASDPVRYIYKDGVVQEGFTLPEEDEEESSDNDENELIIELPTGWNDLEEDELIEKLKKQDVDDEILSHFSKSQEEYVREAVALSPSCSVELLQLLSKDSYWAVERAANRSLIIKGLPEEWSSLDDEEIVQKLQNENVDISILEKLTNFIGKETQSGEEILNAVALHENASESILDKLKDTDIESIIDSIRFRDLPNDWKFLNSNEKQEKLKEEKNIDQEIIKKLSESKDTYLLAELALHPKTTIEILDNLPDDEMIKQNIAFRALPEEWRTSDDLSEKLKEKDIDPKVLEILSTSYERYLKVAVASSPNTPDYILEKLQKENKDDWDYKDIKYAIVCRQLPDEWRYLEDYERLEKLQEEENDVKAKVLEVLTQSDNDEIRTIIASHKNATKEVLNILMKDDDDDIKKAAKNTSIKKGYIDGELEQVDYKYYEKVEPGGIAVFGELDKDYIKKILASKDSGTMDVEILDLKDNGEFRTCWGLFINSDEEEGYQGLIELDPLGALEIPKDTSTDKSKDGYYFCALSLSKVSGGTTFSLPPGEVFKRESFKEVCVPVNFPKCIYEEPMRYIEELSGEYSYTQNIITSFKYNDEDIEYDGDLIDRDYDHLITIVKVDKGEPSLFYRYYHLDGREPTEKWYE